MSKSKHFQQKPQEILRVNNTHDSQANLLQAPQNSLVCKKNCIRSFIMAEINFSRFSTLNLINDEELAIQICNASSILS